MCFETTKTARAKTAKTDIECWKFVNKDLTNAFSRHLNGTRDAQRVRYETGNSMPLVHLKKEKSEGSWETYYIINEGYHSFKTKPKHEELRYWKVDDSDNTIIRKFTIPKGTRYFENNTEYVSETIMLVE